MSSLSTELKGVISRRLEIAGAREILEIASALCADEPAPKPVVSIQPRFEVINDMVRDHSTGLMWSRENVGDQRLPWKDAQDACSKLRLGDFSDWRLPTIKELLTLVDYERHEPAIDTDVFACESSWYWSSTPLHSSPGDCAWGVDFNDGSADWSSRNSNGFVRAVRVGQF